MDPIAHSLFGAAVSRTPWARKVPAATVVLVSAANLPDIDALTYLLGSDAALLLRRGFTHGPLGWLLLIGLQLLALVLWHRRKKRFGGATKAPLLAWTGLTTLGVLSHPALDWLNTYGVRLLMPFDRSWFQADAVFIVDPWMWWALGAAVFLGSDLSPRLRRTAAVAAALATVPVMVAAPGWARLLWLVALLVVVWLDRNLRRGAMKQADSPDIGTDRRGRLAALALSFFVVYIASMLFAGRTARLLTLNELDRRGVQLVDSATYPEASRLMVAPVPVTPFEREVVARTVDGYRFARFSWLPEPSLVLESDVIEPVALRDSHTIVARAWRDPCVAGFVGWARFPWATVEAAADDDGALVRFFDARYVRRPGGGFATAAVEVEDPASPGNP